MQAIYAELQLGNTCHTVILENELQLGNTCHAVILENEPAAARTPWSLADPG